MRDFTTSEYNQAPASSAALALSGEAAFFQKVYLFMGLGLAITAAVAFHMITAQRPLIIHILSNKFLFLALVLAELGVVILFSRLVAVASISAAATMLLVYAVLNGVVFGVIVSLYSPLAVVQAFLSTSLAFGGMSVYGLVTKKSLKKWGGFLYMAIWGLLFAMLINFLISWIWQTRLVLAELVISGVAVVIFSLLTAYKNQELRVMYASTQEQGGQALTRLALAGALSLYLAFVNLFLHLLRIIGIFSQD